LIISKIYRILHYINQQSKGGDLHQTIMTSEQIRQQVELNKKFNVQQKLNLYNMKDHKLDGSKKNWSNAITVYSTKIQLLEQILEYIDQGAVSINNNFINDTK